MTLLLIYLDRFFDLLLLPFRSSGPMYPVAAFAGVTAGVAMWFFRRFTNQRAIRRSRDRLAAHILEIRLFQNQLGVVVRAYGHLLLALGSYFRETLRPLAILALPLMILTVQLDSFFAYSPVPVGQDFLLEAKLRAGVSPSSVSLRLPAGILQTAPTLHLPSEKEVDWRLRAENPGDFRVYIEVAGDSFAKRIAAGPSIVRLSPARDRGGAWHRLLTPGEAPLPGDAPLTSIEVRYPPRDFVLGGISFSWMVPFFALVLLVGIVVKFAFRVEI